MARARGSASPAWKTQAAGDRFGRLELVELVAVHPSRGQQWAARCACGRLVEVTLAELRRELKARRTPQCGTCARTEKRLSRLRLMTGRVGTTRALDLHKGWEEWKGYESHPLDVESMLAEELDGWGR